MVFLERNIVPKFLLGKAFVVVFVLSNYWSVDAWANLDAQLNAITTRVDDSIAGATIGGYVNLIDLRAGDFARLGVKAGIEAYRNDDKVTYSRSERIVFSKSLSLQTPGPAYLQSEIRQGSEVEFIRQFETQADALDVIKHPPYPPSRIPFTAYKALDLEEGDYVRFQTRLALIVGAGVRQALGILEVRGASQYIIYGDFQIEVFKKAGQRVGLRLSSLQKNSRSLNTKLAPNYLLDAFALVGMGDAKKNLVRRKVNEAINKQILPATLIGVGANRANGSLVSLEYEYNLNNALSIQAFENIVNPIHWQWDKYVEFRNQKAFVQRNILTVNTLPTEDIVGQDFGLGEGPVVRSVFRGESLFSENTRGLQIHLPFVQKAKGQSFLEQDFVFRREDGEVSRLKLAQLTLTDNIKALLGLFARELEEEANILFEIDSNGEVIDFHEMNFSYSRDENTHFRYERRLVQGRVHRMLPENYHDQFQLGKISKGLLEKDVNVYMHSSIHANAFPVMSELSIYDIDLVVDHYFEALVRDYKKLPRHRHYAVVNVPSEKPIASGRDGSENLKSWQERTKPYIDRLKQQLQEALLSGSYKTPTERWEILRNLSQDKVFQQLGSGVFIRIAEYASRKFHIPFTDLVSFELRMNSANRQTFSKVLGRPEKSEVMRKVLIARDRILGRKLKSVYWQESGN